jgi:hypothetical protein
MRNHGIGIGTGVLLAAGSLLLASAASAGAPVSFNLNGAFAMEDQNAGDANETCFFLFGSGDFDAFGQVVGTTDQCTVAITYDTDEFNKASNSVLKDDDSGTVKISQQVENDMSVSISGAECPALLGAGATPVDCKVSASLKGNDGANTTEKGKASVSCELGSNFSEFGVLSQAQVDEIVDAFAGRSDVKVDADGKLTIKSKGVPNTGTSICVAI